MPQITVNDILNSSSIFNVRIGISIDQVREILGTEDDMGRLSKRSIILKYSNMQIYLTNYLVDMITVYINGEGYIDFIISDSESIKSSIIESIIKNSGVCIKRKDENGEELNILTMSGVNFHFTNDRISSISLLSA